MVAGEPSGDLLASLLLKSLRARWPGLCAGGIGGPQMAAQHFNAWWPTERLAVRGYLEVLPIMCDIDYKTAALMHAKLYRDHTLAGSGEVCDYWFVGDKVENPK